MACSFLFFARYPGVVCQSMRAARIKRIQPKAKVNWVRLIISVSFGPMKPPASMARPMPTPSFQLMKLILE